MCISATLSSTSSIFFLSFSFGGINQLSKLFPICIAKFPVHTGFVANLTICFVLNQFHICFVVGIGTIGLGIFGDKLSEVCQDAIEPFALQNRKPMMP